MTIVKKKSMLKEKIKKIEKTLLLNFKKLEDALNTLSTIKEQYKKLNEIKTNSNLSKKYLEELTRIIDKSKIIENNSKTINLLSKINDQIQEIKIPSRDANNFLDRFRNTAKYKIRNISLKYRFLSGFLDGFAEIYTFKPEFIGIVNLEDIVKEAGGIIKSNNIILEYNDIPKIIDISFKKN